MKERIALGASKHLDFDDLPITTCPNCSHVLPALKGGRSESFLFYCSHCLTANQEGNEMTKLETWAIVGDRHTCCPKCLTLFSFDVVDIDNPQAGQPVISCVDEECGFLFPLKLNRRGDFCPPLLESNTQDD